MAIKFFLMYAGSLLACSIILLTIVKQFAGAFAVGGKKPVIYGTVSSAVASLAAYSSTYITDHLFTVFWIFAGVFLLFGIIHMILVHNKYFTSDSGENSSKIFIGELLFALSVVFFTILVFSSLQYFIKDKSFLFYPMMLSTLAFFIPVLTVHTFQAAYDIPPPVYSTWHYPEEPINLPDDNPNEKLLVIGFEMGKKVNDFKRTYFRAKAPENIKLGDLFYHFINDYNELQSETPIEFADKTGEPYEWWYRIKPKWYQGKRIIDPNLSVRDNGIKENTVIICERILKSS